MKAKYIRIITVGGILLLLVLQYIWFKNSYILMEHDTIEKTQKTLRETIEADLYKRLTLFSINVKMQDGKNFNNSEVVSQKNIKESDDIANSLQDFAKSVGKPCTITGIDTIFSKKLKKNIGFIPKYSLRFVNESLVQNSQPNKYTLYSKVTDNQYVEVTLTSPMGSILRQAQFILIVSILLAIMIGIILLYQLKSMLRENKFVDFIKDYTHALTHELKTPISGIYMSASQLASGKLEDKPDSRKIHYQICRDQSSKLLKTVERILLVAKAEHTSIIPSYENVALKPYIEKIAEAYRQNNYRHKNLEIDTKISPESFAWDFDPVLIENVFSNLIDNAIKYSDNSIKIEISCANLEGKMRLSIKDNGFGIKEKDLKHIFDNFERGDKMESKGIDGFGIGLNYVQKVIKAHKGIIRVNSKEGQGSEFIIELPQKN